MTEPCAECGAGELVAVMIPGHGEIQAVLCVRCGAFQPSDLGETAIDKATGVSRDTHPSGR